MPLGYNSLPPSSKGVIDNGLVLNLDSSYTASYPRSGTTWTDIDSRLAFTNQGTNGLPTFSSANQGTLNFLNTGTSRMYSQNTTQNVGRFQRFSVNTWFRNNGGPTGNGCYFTSRFAPTTDINFIIGYNGTSDAWPGLGVQGGFYNSPEGFYYTSSTGFNPVNNVWYNACLTYNGTTGVGATGSLKLYVNGSLHSTNGTTGPPRTPTNTFTNGYVVAKRWDGTSDFVNAQIPVVNVYNRELSASEVQYNYDTLKGRYS